MLSSDDHDALQKDLHAIEGWSDLWGMFFNASKCKYPSISKMKKPMNLSYQFGNNILAKIQCEKDLGVLVNSKLSWHDHIINKVNTPNKVLGLIRLKILWVACHWLMLLKSCMFTTLDHILIMPLKCGLRIKLI